MQYKSFLFLLIVVATGCVDPFTTKTERITERIVVEGGITNQAPPYSVTLTKTANFSQNLDGIPRHISGATIKVCDGEGNCIPFFEVSNGHYQTATNAQRGQIGKTYHLEVTTADGKRIASFPEQLNSSPPILRGYSEYDPETVLQDGFTVYVDTDDPPSERNYYKWETENYYPYSERFCFTRFYERNIQYIASDKNVDGNIISRAPVEVVALSSSSTFVVQVYQLAITANAYEFLDRIKKQANTSGSIFDPPPTFLRGNLYNVEDDSDEVLGYFIVAGASRIDIVIDRSIPGKTPRSENPLAKEPLYCGDPCDPLCASFGGGTCGDRPCPPECANLPGKTNIAPDAWPHFHQECGN